MDNILTIAPSPHIHTSRTVRGAMGHVLVALLPAVACAIFYFGWGAAIVIAMSVAVCMAAEWLVDRLLLKRRSTLGDLSAALTGLLLALNLPSNLPLWTVAIGAVVAIGVGKMTFGGLGCNIFNPALVGRVFLLLSFPVAMTQWPLPLVNRARYTDAITGPTILGELKLGQFDPSQFDFWSKAFGEAGGSLGEVSAVALVLGLAYLLVTRTISWHIPVSIIATVALFSLCIGQDVGLQVFGGGLLLGSIFMATDYVTSPMNSRGMLVYGVFIGLVTVIIRRWGAYPEGVSFAILLANGVTPLINRYVKPRKFGEGLKERRVPA